jgi:hypothetical protein
MTEQGPRPLWTNRRFLILLAITVGLLTAVFIIPIHRMAFHFQSDFSAHIRWASELANGQAKFYPGGIIFDSQNILPHFLYQLFTVLVAQLPGISLTNAGFIVALLSIVVTGVIVFRWLDTAWHNTHWLTGLITIGLTLCLLILAPIATRWTANNLIFGYLSPNVYHNPTYLMLRPFALLLFGYAVRCFTMTGEQRVGRWDIAAAVLLTVLGAYTKPSYLIALLPVMGLGLGLQLLRRRPVDWKLSIVGIIIPGIVVLFAQYLLNFGQENANSIVLEPLAFLTTHGIQNGLLKGLASIAFPIIVYSLYFRQARRDAGFNLAWLVFGVGATYFYLLAETGRFEHGNFLWSAVTTLFILYGTAVRFLITIMPPVDKAWRSSRVWMVVGVLGLHSSSGMLWYYYQTFQ